MNATLAGSEKQVAWAGELRSKAIGEIDAILGRIDATLTSPTSNEARARAVLGAARDHLAGITTAAWWIEHRRTATGRDVPSRNLLLDAAREMCLRDDPEATDDPRWGHVSPLSDVANDLVCDYGD
jgi:hypothetical protein